MNSAVKRTQSIIAHLVSNVELADIALIGLAVMGENLILNMASKGFTVACWNRTLPRVNDFVHGRGKNKSIIGCQSLEELVKVLKRPRRVMIMVRAGDPVDSTIRQLLPLLERGDIIIDGGNSNYLDTNRRIQTLSQKGILFLGVGVSGGEEGALLGPSIMPGGSHEAWNHTKHIFQKISAKVAGDGTPCCDFVGEGGSGHFVKMVHNGIEYGDMQLLAEAYHLLSAHLKLSNSEIADVFSEWNSGDLDSYLVEISADIFRKKDEKSGKYVLDLILDAAGQKGTGKWTVENALELGAPVTLISEAVFARTLSAHIEERVHASKVLRGPKKSTTITPAYRKIFLNDLRDAVYASKIVSYAQGFLLLREAAAEYKWNLNYGGIALMWRGGCIIRSKFLGKISDAFRKNPDLQNLILDDFFREKIEQAQVGWRHVVSVSVEEGYAMPAVSAALTYFDGLRTARGPANLLQAQRDYFGAHMYERVDKPRGEFFHTNWTGHGGTTASSTYNA